MNTKPLARSERLALRVEPEIRVMLAELTAATGLDVSNVIRTLIRREHARLSKAGEIKPAKGGKRHG